MTSRARAASRVVLDEAARRRRQRKALEALEQDNFHDDPHANLVMHKKAPKFEEALDGRTRPDRKRKARSFEYFKQRFRKNFSALLEEEQQRLREEKQQEEGEEKSKEKEKCEEQQVSYSSATARPSRLPERHLCAVCGFPSHYTCVQCGTRYCSSRCLHTHQDTRCLKWTS